jgi:hypothetical protein
MWIKLWIKKNILLLALLALVTIGATVSAVRAQNDTPPTPTPTPADSAAQAAALLADLNEPQPFDKLPPYILLVAQRTAPGAQYSGFRWELSDNLRPLYELQGVQENKQLEIGIFLDGSIDRVNRTITMSDVPVDVTGMLDKYVRDFEVSSITEATLASGVNRFFEFAGRSGGINLVVEIADSASQIRIVELK